MKKPMPLAIRILFGLFGLAMIVTGLVQMFGGIREMTQ